MAYNFAKLNNTSPFASLDLKLEAIEKTMTLSQMASEGAVYPVVALMFSTKGEYGKSVFMVGRDEADDLFTAWLPNHMVEKCEMLLADEEAVQGILDGLCGVKAKAYTDKKGKHLMAIDSQPLFPNG